MPRQPQKLVGNRCAEKLAPQYLSTEKHQSSWPRRKLLDKQYKQKGSREFNVIRLKSEKKVKINHWARNSAKLGQLPPYSNKDPSHPSLSPYEEERITNFPITETKIDRGRERHSLEVRTTKPFSIETQRPVDPETSLRLKDKLNKQSTLETYYRW